MKTKALPGFRDFYPADLALRTHIFRTWRTVAGRYGFEEYDGPPLEPLDLYTAKSGEEIVGQLYNFKDKGDRDVALRPEMTPTLARMVAARAGELRKPIRWFSIPQLFRYERQQRGRLREHFQLNCDLIGEPGPLADAEIIALAIDVIRGFGLGADTVRVRLSDRRLLNALLASFHLGEAQASAIYAWLDKQGRRSDAAQRQRLEDLEIDPGIADFLNAATEVKDIGKLKRVLSHKPEAAAALGSLEQVVEALHAMGLGDFIDLDLGIVRGLAYYTGTVFELFDTGRTLRAICGGGRYDSLLHALGDADLPSVGFGMGDVVLTELLRDKEMVPTDISSIDVFVAFISKDDLPHVLALAHRLRDAGLRVEYSLAPQAVGKQLNLADARNARLALVLGPDERARGEIVVKDLRSGSQEAVPLSASLEIIKARIHG
ncbi:MAG TPA: histidine--tRNA ligase [Gemmatimonadales bacterium]|jgi:histidyl-tRNA synthetase|nr:histidine--tRNA ligase [Gemmatimonadales bacterium]